LINKKRPLRVVFCYVSFKLAFKKTAAENNKKYDYGADINVKCGATALVTVTVVAFAAVFFSTENSATG